MKDNTLQQRHRAHAPALPSLGLPPLGLPPLGLPPLGLPPLGLPPLGLALLGLALLGLSSAGCGGAPAKPAQPFYDTTTIVADPAKSDRRADYERAAGETLKKHRVVWIEGAAARPLTAADLKTLPLPTVVAVAQARHLPRGGERDALLQVDGKRYAFTTWMDHASAARIEGGAEWHPDRAPPLAAGTTADAQLLAGEGWEPGLRTDVLRAWGMLLPAERARLAGVRFHRIKGGGKGKGDNAHGGQYIANERGHRIEIYDPTAQSRLRGFAGPLAAPLPRPVLTVFHEVGHGLSAFVRLEATRRHNASVPKANAAQGAARTAATARLKALADAAKKLARSNPVLAAYGKALGADRAPTTYGASSAEESFAEAFALYRADPEALLRLRPKVHAWFAAGGHLQALDAALAALPAAL